MFWNSSPRWSVPPTLTIGQAVMPLLAVYSRRSLGTVCSIRARQLLARLIVNSTPIAEPLQTAAGGAAPDRRRRRGAEDRARLGVELDVLQRAAHRVEQVGRHEGVDHRQDR